jgi:hypothetical protein
MLPMHVMHDGLMGVAIPSAQENMLKAFPSTLPSAGVASSLGRWVGTFSARTSNTCIFGSHASQTGCLNPLFSDTNVIALQTERHMHPEEAFPGVPA